VIDGYVVETGIGFVISLDYDKFKEIFEVRKMRRKASKVGKRKEDDEE